MASAAAEDRERVLALLRRHGDSTTSFQVLEAGMRYWFCDDDACVAYADTGRAWVGAGAPIAAPARRAQVMEKFCDAARHAGRRPRFFGLEQPDPDQRDLAAIPVGEQPIWDPQRWDDVLSHKRSLREQLRRARAKGVAIRRLSADDLSDPKSQARRRVDAMIAHWLERRHMAPMGFLVHLDPYSFPDERIVLVAERGDTVVGMLAAVPIFSRDGWFLEDVLRDPAAPNGTIELLIDRAMRISAEAGSHYVTYGLAPLAGASGWLRFVRDRTRWLYDFEGLRAFKSKLRPGAWNPVYLAFPRGERGVSAIFDSLAAFARGSLIRFGVATLRHRAAAVVRLLAALLVPWTLVLAMAPGRWFPSPAVKAAWLAYDALLFVGLWSLARRWRRRLALLLCGGALADFALGTVQAAAYNAHHARGGVEWAIVAAALAAPLFASAFLFFARNRAGLYQPERMWSGPEALFPSQWAPSDSNTRPTA